MDSTKDVPTTFQGGGPSAPHACKGQESLPLLASRCPLLPPSDFFDAPSGTQNSCRLLKRRRNFSAIFGKFSGIFNYSGDFWKMINKTTMKKNFVRKKFSGTETDKHLYPTKNWISLSLLCIGRCVPKPIFFHAPGPFQGYFVGALQPWRT